MWWSSSSSSSMGGLAVARMISSSCNLITWRCCYVVDRPLYALVMMMMMMMGTCEHTSMMVIGVRGSRFI
jgi:hypothetical protein